MTDARPYLGIIEGFFGRSWSWEERASYAPFLKSYSYSFYVYAPKEESFLRKQWSERFPEERFAALASLSATFKKHGVSFGVGLSPFEAYREYGPATKRKLQEKVRALNGLSLDILCVLFDDMRGDLPDLAATQIRLLSDIREVSEAKRIVFCPTYYSYDPIIERVFGAMPQRYLESLGEELDPSIDLFWTGERVMSTEYPVRHLEEIGERLRRKPFLWDNYPVNDTRKASSFIFLRPFENRGAHLRGLTSGHAVNPMKQPWLSQIPVATLPTNYTHEGPYDRDAAFKACAKNICGEEIGEMLFEDLSLFQDVGLIGLGDAQKEYLRVRYGARPDNPFCREVVQWLDNHYAFDPACLTD